MSDAFTDDDLANAEDRMRQAEAARSATPSSEEGGLREAIKDELINFGYDFPGDRPRNLADAIVRRFRAAATPDNAGRSPIDVETWRTALGTAREALATVTAVQEVARQAGNVDLFAALEPARHAHGVVVAALSESTGSEEGR